VALDDAVEEVEGGVGVDLENAVDHTVSRRRNYLTVDSSTVSLFGTNLETTAHYRGIDCYPLIPVMYTAR